jgi:outer membrane protein TolC
MGKDISEEIVLSDKLSGFTVAEIEQELSKAPADPYENRIEYSLLNTQKDAAGLELKNIQAGYLPKLYGSATLGANTSASKFLDLSSVQDRWFKYNQIGFSLQIPVFDSFIKYRQAQQKRINILKLENTSALLKNSIRLETNQAKTNLKNGLAKLDIQKKNLDLASEISRVTKVKYQKGLGTNLEVINAESSLKEAQVNYYSAMYDVLVAKVDLEKATGQLLQQ